MSRLTRLSVSALAALIGALWLTAPAAGQTWTPSKTPDGQPDIQGTWEGGADSANAGHSLEEGCCDPEHNKMQQRAKAGHHRSCERTNSIRAVGRRETEGASHQPGGANRAAAHRA